MNVGIDPMTMEMFGDGDENDDDLEAELAALRGGQPQQKQRRPKRSQFDTKAIVLWRFFFVMHHGSMGNYFTQILILTFYSVLMPYAVFQILWIYPQLMRWQPSV